MRCTDALPAVDDRTDRWPVRLAIFHDYLETIGGAERVVLLLARHFDADLVTTTFDADLPARAGFPDVRVVSLGGLRRGPPMKQLDASWKFSRCRFPGYDMYLFSGNWAHFAATRHRPNAYYCHTPTRVFYDQKAAVLGRLPAHRRLVARSWIALHSAWERRSVGRCERIVANSENVRERIRRYYGREATVVYPPAPTSRFRYREIGGPWLAVTRLYPEKRIELLLDAFRRLPDERLDIVGGYSKGDRAEGYVASLRPPSNVRFLGEVPEDVLLDLYSRCRGFVTAATDEDFGLTPVEAMASGKCVLATDEGGHRETILEGRTGFLLPPDPEAFVRCIRELDDATLTSMRDACIVQARRFDESAFLGAMESILRR